MEVSYNTNYISKLFLMHISGCGRFFEGKPEEMHVALNKTLASLPDDTVVYVSHNYSVG